MPVVATQVFYEKLNLLLHLAFIARGPLPVIFGCSWRHIRRMLQYLG